MHHGAGGCADVGGSAGLCGLGGSAGFGGFGGSAGCGGLGTSTDRSGSEFGAVAPTEMSASSVGAIEIRVGVIDTPAAISALSVVLMLMRVGFMLMATDTSAAPVSESCISSTAQSKSDAQSFCLQTANPQQ